MVRVWKLYQAYQSVGYGHDGSCTKLTKVSGTGMMDVVPSLPKCRVRVIQGVRTPATHWLVHCLTYLEIVVCCLLSTYGVGSVLTRAIERPRPKS